MRNSENMFYCVEIYCNFLLLSSYHSLSFFFVSLFYCFYKIFSLSEKAIKIMFFKVIVSVNSLGKSSSLQLFNIQTSTKMQWFPIHRAAKICNDILFKTSFYFILTLTCNPGRNRIYKIRVCVLIAQATSMPW